ncbi:MAG TPA: aminopeptidase [Verrucomicrobiae bacterium]|nr:aminopeptidase [Verrucomicrobiae bacterium]
MFPRKPRTRKWLLLISLTAVVLAVSGCRTLKFYGQAIKGQYQIFTHQEPIEELVADQKTPARLREQLELLQKLRAFADAELKLPVDGHYRKYVDVHRPYVVWNVQAAPRFSLEPKTWWYPLVGSLEYRGYFSERDAKGYAAALRKKGFDVFVGGVDAYSTLGWFKDPVLNTFIYRDEPELAEVIFHELGHQRVFARGDTDFNEAFATVVGQEGARRWLRLQGNTNSYEHYLVSLRRNEQFVRLIMNTRARLEKVYGDQRDEDGKVKAAKQLPKPPEELDVEKRQVFADMQSRYSELKTNWNGYAGYDRWFHREVNNAQLNTIANYYDYVPGFEELLKLKDGDLEKFYAAAEELAKKSQEERHEWLRNLAESDRPESRIDPGISN